MELDIPQVNDDFGVSDAELDTLLKDEVDGPTQPKFEAEPVHQETEKVATEPVKVETKAAPVAAPTPEVKPQEALHEFTVNGRVIRGSLSQVIKWAQQGYDYPQKMAELNKHRETLSAMEKTYKPIDEWVRANPQQWDRLQATIKGAQQGLTDVPPQVLQRLQKYEQRFQELDKEKQAAKFKAEDQQLDTEIKSIREKYKDLDWASTDELGRSQMEVKVLQHGSQNGFRNFRAAFLDLYHDDLLKNAETRAKEQFAATKELQAKKGLLPKPAAPELKKSEAKGKFYPSTQSILEELGNAT